MILLFSGIKSPRSSHLASLHRLSRSRNSRLLSRTSYVVCGSPLGRVDVRQEGQPGQGHSRVHREDSIGHEETHAHQTLRHEGESEECLHRERHLPSAVAPGLNARRQGPRRRRGRVKVFFRSCFISYPQECVGEVVGRG